MLLDTASLYFRAFFGVPDSVTAPDGTPVNAVRGLLDFITRLVGEYHPTHLACCWDNDWRPQWRVDLVPSYKAHRVARPLRGEGDGGRHWLEVVPDPLETQIPVIEEMYQVDAQDLEEARHIVREDAPAVFKMGGRMCEPTTHSRWAQRMIAQAEIYGVRQS